MIDSETRKRVRHRAGDACEYCGLQQIDSPFARLHIEHIRPKKHGGDDAVENLALACIDCNLAKGTNLTGIDPESQQLTPLFNPREQMWADHFEWRGIFLVGKTAVGRTTTDVLRMNSEEQLQLRAALRHP